MAFDRDALFMQARMAFEGGNLTEARRVAEEIVARRRNDFDAFMLLGNVCGSLPDSAGQVRAVSQAVRVKPKHAGARTHLGRCLLVTRQIREAIQQFEKSLKLDPNQADALVGLAEAYEYRNSYAKARAALAPLLRGSASAIPPIAAAVELRLHLKEENPAVAIEIGEAVRAAGHPPTRGLRDTLFALAKAYEQSGKYEQAVTVAGEANRTGAIPFEIDRHEAQFAAIAAAFPRDTIAAFPRPEETSDVPVFLVGMPRTGSTLIERIIHAHPAAFGAGELDNIPTIARTLASETGAIPPSIVGTGLNAETLGRHASAYVAHLRSLAPRGVERIADKFLGNFMYLGVINALFPEARVIHCRRRAIDTCLSCYMERLTARQAPFAARMDDLGRAYCAYEALMKHWRSALTMPLLEVDYEELIDDQTGTTRRILEFCGLPWDDACLRFHEVDRVDGTISYDQVRRPLYRQAVGRADRFGALLDPLRKALGET